AEAFWHRQLEGFKTPTPLVVDRSYGPDEEPRFKTQNRGLGERLSSELRAYARRHQLTPGTLFQGAWGMLLHGYSHEPSVVFGVTMSGRPADLHGIEEMVGL